MSSKYLDESTSLIHTKKFGYQCTSGRAIEAPKLHAFSRACYQEELDESGYQQWEWLQHVDGSHTGSVRKLGRRARELDMVERHDVTTCSRSQVLQGYKWRVQGSNGLNAAQLSHPWGSTRTFQRTQAGVSWAHGLRHGVTMHPRGRHLREGRILRSHGTSTHLEREQQPPHQLQHYNRGPKGCGKNF